MNWFGRAVQSKLQEEQDAKDAEVLATIVNPPRERIVRSAYLNDGEAYEIPGEQFEDGLPRLIVSPTQYLHPTTLAAFQ